MGAGGGGIDPCYVYMVKKALQCAKASTQLLAESLCPS
jgi:hypothetical protein